MNSIINQNRLIELMSQLSGRDAAACESFLAAFTTAVREGLADYEEVTVPYLGRFSLEGLDNKIVFAASKQMAADVNAPFEMFVPETLAPEVDDEQLAAVDAAASKSMVEGIPVPKPWEDEMESEEKKEATPEPEIEYEAAPIAEPEEAPEPELEYEPEPEPEPAPEPMPYVAPAPDPAAAPAPKPQAIASAYQADDDEDEEEDEMPQSQASPSKFWMIWALVIGFLLGLAVGFFVHDPIQEALEPSLADDYESEYLEEDTGVVDEIPTDEEGTEATPESTPEPVPVTAEQPKTEDKPASVQATPQAKPKVVYDSVRSGYYLTSMAKKHYGYDKYWVYIYLENQSKINNPNRISTDTKLVIPPLEKYAPGGDTPQNRAAAQKKEAEINRKFK